MAKTDLSALPSVDRLLGTQAAAELVADFGRPLALEALRAVLEAVRAEMRAEAGTLPTSELLFQRARDLLHAWSATTLQPVINAAGVIIHTNLGRAPLSQAAIHAMQGVAQGYSTLEYDLEKGQRGSRYLHTEDLLLRLTGAEAALVVNNNASALLLILTALAKRRRVLISRTQLIEIGGGFRIPDIMKQSGALLVEVGATNRVHLRDYQQALDEQPIKLLLRAHQSNFRIEGFTSEPALAQLVEIAHAAGLPLVDDLGSGTFLDTSRFGLAYEPTVQDSLEAGADLVCFSGDKLLGGPQAGIILGRADLVKKLKVHPLARALRADKLCLAALSATLLHYVKDEAERQVPVWRMIATTLDLLRARAQSWAAELGRGEVIAGDSAVGGGSLPGETLPTFLLALEASSPDDLFAALRAQNPPIIARVQEEQVVLDPRTVLPEQDGALLVGIQKALAALG